MSESKFIKTFKTQLFQYITDHKGKHPTPLPVTANGMQYLDAVKTAVQKTAHLLNHIEGDFVIDYRHFKSIIVVTKSLWFMSVMVEALEHNGFEVAPLSVWYDQKQDKHVCHLYYVPVKASTH